MTTVLASILSATQDARIRASMALGALLEGGSLGAGPFPAGDQGTSLGPFQIHLPAHPGVSGSQAQNPTSAVAFMLPEYTGAVARVPSSLWASNPQQAAEKAAMLAERPAQDYYTARPGAVQRAWTSVQSALATGNLATGGSASPAPSSSTNATPAGLIPTPSGAASAAIRVVIIGTGIAAGAGLVLLGLNKATGNPIGKSAKVAATVAPLAL